MTISRGRRSRESRKAPSEKVKDAGRINPDQKKFLRKLLYVLADIVDEKGHFRDGDEAGTSILAESDSEDEHEENNLKYSKDRGTHGRAQRPAQGHQHKESEKGEGGNDAKNLAHFKRLCEAHGQLTFQIRSSLNALGGGGRTARALEAMHDEIALIKDCFFTIRKTIYFKIFTGVPALNTSHKAALEVTKSFRELGVFNTSFFGELESIQKQLMIAAAKLDGEYGTVDLIYVDDYVDSILEPLAFAFEAFVRELTNIAEKATIRMTQDFSSQRYLNLTTVATFLSSVTATTLQITADAFVSALETVMNTLWFISLVFSTASAVYSLLIMTWRQSSVRQPDQSLPPWANVWLRNGPMFALIAAVTTFSIGLCLLAFQVAVQQGHLASAAVPTAFAGLNASTIFLISAWFLLEQWKERHAESWVSMRDKYLIPVAARVKEAAVETRVYGHRMKRRLRNFCTSFALKRGRVTPSTGVDKKIVGDVESGKGATVGPPVPSAKAEESPEHLSSKQSNAVQDTPEAAEPENVLAVPERMSTLPESDARQTESSNKPEEVEKYKPFENLLQFSPSGRLLASAFSDTVVIYDANNSFAVLNTYKLPDADPVKQIAWNPHGELLVRSSRRVSVYGVNDTQNPNDHSTRYLDQAVRSVRWVDIEDAGIRGFACAINGMVKLFDNNCKELWSYDLSRIIAIDRIFDVAFFRKKYVLCLVDVPEREEQENRLLIVNTDNNSVERGHSVRSDQKSMILSDVSGTVLFYGSDDGVEVAELLTLDDHSLGIGQHYTLWGETYPVEELARPEEVLTFHGKDDKMIIGVSEGEIVVLYRLPEKPYSALHIFTTPSTNAIMQNPVSFAVRPQGPYCLPYMFAFGDGNGSVKIWSVQSDVRHSMLDLEEDFEVHDRRKGHLEEPSISTGRFLTLPPPLAVLVQ